MNNQTPTEKTLIALADSHNRLVRAGSDVADLRTDINERGIAICEKMSGDELFNLACLLRSMALRRQLGADFSGNPT